MLAEAGVERAAALALVYDDDETNIRAALTARRLNPRCGSSCGSTTGGWASTSRNSSTRRPRWRPAARTGPAAVFDASTTVLSDADTAAPALAATALAGTSKVVQTDGLMLRAVERPAAAAG